MLTRSKVHPGTREARRSARAKAELRWRRAKTLPKACGVLVLATIGFLALLPFLRLGPFSPIVAGSAALLNVLAMMGCSLSHRAAFMKVQASRGVSDAVAEQAYTLERPFA
jgi:hypothetical protein